MEGIAGVLWGNLSNCTYTFQTLSQVWQHKKHDMNLGGFAKTWG